MTLPSNSISLVGLCVFIVMRDGDAEVKNKNDYSDGILIADDSLLIYPDRKSVV